MAAPSGHVVAPQPSPARDCRRAEGNDDDEKTRTHSPDGVRNIVHGHSASSTSSSSSSSSQRRPEVEMIETAGVPAGRGGGGGGAGELRGIKDGEDAMQEAQTQQQGRYRVYKRRWFGLVQLTLMNIVVSWDWLTFSPVSSQAAAFFSTTETTINWLSTAFLFAFVAACPAVIWVLHRGPKLSIVTSALLLLAGNWIRYGGTRCSPPSFAAVMVGQILTGLAQPFVLTAPARYSDLWFTNRGRVAATALATLANPLGAAIGQLVVPFWVSRPADVSRMVLYVSIISTVASLPSFLIPSRPATPPSPSATTVKTALLPSLRTLATSPEFWLLYTPFSIYVAIFNTISTLLNQILEPYGLTPDEAGLAGAVLILVGLVTSAVTSPILDRTKRFLPAVKMLVPLIAASLVAFIWMPQTAAVPGPYAVLAVLGASSFALLPVAVEMLVELTHPVSPEVTSALAWSGGQLLGGCFIVILDALRADDADDDNARRTDDPWGPPRNMKRGLVFVAVIAVVAAVPPMLLGLFGRRDMVVLRRVRSDSEAGANVGQDAEASNVSAV